MKVNFYNTQNALEVSESLSVRIVNALLSFKKIQTDEVSLHFVDKQTISCLHQNFFSDPTPTDCISFPLDRPGEKSGGYHVLGEIFVCPEIALEYARENALSPQSELYLYVIHGLLHLIGYEDTSLVTEKIMRSEEKRCIEYLKEQTILT